MIKKLLLLSAIASVTACTSYNEYKSCDPEKNYIISDPVAMEEYKKLINDKKIKSYYTKLIPTKDCLNSMCVIYDDKKFEYVEKYFDDKDRKGIYTITAIEDLSNPNCMTEHPFYKSHKNKKCYILLKNKDNIVKSRYEYLVTQEDQTTKIEFKDLINKTNLYTYSYQVYSTGAIGGPGGGNCPIKKINNPNYKFNPYTFLND